MAKSYRDLLPPPLRSDARFAALAGLLNDWKALDVDRVRTLGRIDAASDWLLQHLAAWMSLDDEAYWTVADDAERRNLLLSAVQLHRKKGTRWSVLEALRLIGVTGDLIEWWQQTPKGTPHTFCLTAWVNENLGGGATVLSQDTYDRIAELVNAYKPARSHYTFQVGARFDGGIGIATTFSCASVATNQVDAVHPERLNTAHLAIGAVARCTAVSHHVMEAA